MFFASSLIVSPSIVMEAPPGVENTILSWTITCDVVGPPPSPGGETLSA